MRRSRPGVRETSCGPGTRALTDPGQTVGSVEDQISLDPTPRVAPVEEVGRHARAEDGDGVGAGGAQASWSRDQKSRLRFENLSQLF